MGTVALSTNTQSLSRGGLREGRPRAGAPLREGTDLVDNKRIDPFEPLQRLRVLDHDGDRARRPVAVMIDMGVARPGAQGHVMKGPARR